jgi:hypothetical protein
MIGSNVVIQALPRRYALAMLSPTRSLRVNGGMQGSSVLSLKRLNNIVVNPARVRFVQRAREFSMRSFKAPRKADEGETSSTLVEKQQVQPADAPSSPVCSVTESFFGSSPFEKVLILKGDVVGPAVACKDSTNSTTRQYLRECLLVLVQIFELYGFDAGSGVDTDGKPIAAAALLPTLDRWSVQVESLGGGEKQAMKFVKWKLAAFRAYFVDSPLPEALATTVPESPNYLIGGRAGRWLRSMLPKWDDFELHGFLCTVRDGKKAMPRPSKALCTKEALEARTRLTTAKIQPCGSVLMPWGEIPEKGPEVEPVLNKETAIRQLRRTVTELFSGKVFTAADRIKPLFPSTHSSFSSNRSKLGVVGAIIRSPWFEQFRTHDTLVKTKTVRTHWAPNPIAPPKDRTHLVLPSVRPHESPDYVGPKPVFPQEMNEPLPRLISPAGFRRNSPMAPSLKNGREPTKVVVDDTGLQVVAGQLWKRILDAAAEELPEVKMVVLPEALKMRPISKGPAYTYTVLKSLQKFLWSTLKDHPTFKLIGSEPVNPRIIFERMGHLSPGFRFLSGDYQAATDNFAPWVSEAIVEALSDVLNLKPIERELFLRAMTRHQFPDPKSGVSLPQKWGQLMGSIVSFPVLCIANAAWCRWAEELDRQQVLALQKTRLLVNGDDCLLMLRDRGRAAWRTITSFGGLQESVGKTFDSAKFCEINSQTFLYRPLQAVPELWTRDDGTVTTRMNPYFSVPSINLGLVYGMKRSGQAVGLDDVATSSSRDGTISERHFALFASCPPAQWPAVNKLFLEHHASLLRLSTKLAVPWFVPTWLGGLGLCGVVSDTDRRISTGLVRDWAVLPPSQRPRLPQVDTPWRIHALVQERSAHLEDSKRILPARQMAMSDKLYGLLCVESLFRADVSAEDMFREEEEALSVDTSFKAACRHGKLWKTRLRDAQLPRAARLAGPWRSDIEETVAFFDTLRARTQLGWNVHWERTRVPDLRTLSEGKQSAMAAGFVDRGRLLPAAGGGLALAFLQPSPPPTTLLRERIPLIRDREDPTSLGMGL